MKILYKFDKNQWEKEYVGAHASNNSHNFMKSQWSRQSTVFGYHNISSFWIHLMRIYERTNLLDHRHTTILKIHNFSLNKTNISPPPLEKKVFWYHITLFRTELISCIKLVRIRQRMNHEKKLAILKASCAREGRLVQCVLGQQLLHGVLQ